MEFRIIFLIVGLLAVAWYVVTSIMICGALQKRGIKINYLMLRMLTIKYASQYKEITLKETGNVGPLFYHWIISINIALVFFILYVLIRIF